MRNIPMMSLEEKYNTKQKKQLAIFENLEKDIPFANANTLGELVHFQNTTQTPVQRWFSYREGYSVDLVDLFIKNLNINGLVFDPFVGSGTTLLAARKNGLKSIGFDVNPISALVSTVANEAYSKEDIISLRKEIELLQQLRKCNKNYHTAFELAEKVFNSDILQSLLQIKEHIEHIANERAKNVFFVAWLSIIESVSNIKKEGNGIKYKNRKRTPKGYITIDKKKWEASVFPQDKFYFVQTKLLELLKTIVYDISNCYGEIMHKPKVFNDDCLLFDQKFSEKIELTFYSPPYCNCFDYFEIHKVDLWLGEFVKSQKDFRTLRKTGFRSNTNSTSRKEISYTNKKLESLLSLLNMERLWNKKIPNVIKGYFDDTYTLLSKLYSQTTNGGFVGIVVGNSAYTGVIIPTDLLIADIAKEIGFKVKNIYITRHLTTSSQQKRELESLKYFLRESIVLLEK